MAETYGLTRRVSQGWDRVSVAIESPWPGVAALRVANFLRMDLSDVESILKITLPPRHRQAILDSSDPIRQRCDFLVTREQSESLDIVRTNASLHSRDVHEPWPDFLVAFASNGCGDYFAYDTREWPTQIIYIDPDRTVQENLSDTSEDKLRYDTFESWYESYIS